jgi:hypothetical protein
MKHPVIHIPLSSQAEFRGQTAGLKRGKAVKVRAPPNFIHRPAGNISLPPRHGTRARLPSPVVANER